MYRYLQENGVPCRVLTFRKIFLLFEVRICNKNDLEIYCDNLKKRIYIYILLICSKIFLSLYTGNIYQIRYFIQH